MLRWRLISAAILIACTVTLVAIDYYRVAGAPAGLWMLPLYVCTIVAATHEVLSLLKEKQIRVEPWPVHLGSLAIALAACIPMAHEPCAYFGIHLPRHEPFAWPFLAITVAMIAVCAREISRFEQPSTHVLHIALSLFAMMYVGGLGSFFASLRLMHRESTVGLVALLSLMIVVKMSDVGAYAFGRLFGRHKLIPRLSPGKTVEGAWGGLLMGCLAALGCTHYLAPWLINEHWRLPTLTASLGYGVILTVAGMIGDLTESMLKREMGRKDSSNWLPGLGGVLDILDSLLTTAPLAYLYWEWVFLP